MSGTAGQEPTGDEYQPDVPAPSFAPEEPTDGREVGEWESRYTERAALGAIRFEAAYVFVVIIFCLIAILAIAVQSVWRPIEIIASGWPSLSPFLLAFLGGCVGGSLFAMKWLYHSVARGTWNRDRRLWRLFTPFLSGGAALAVILLSAAGVIPLFGPHLVLQNVGALGISIFLGYFSDRAFSALERFAEQQFGQHRSQREDKS